MLQKKKISKNLYEICLLKTTSMLFCVCKQLSTTSMRKLLILDMQFQNYDVVITFEYMKS